MLNKKLTHHQFIISQRQKVIYKARRCSTKVYIYSIHTTTVMDFKFEVGTCLDVVVFQALFLSTFLMHSHAQDFRKTEFWRKIIWVLQHQNRVFSFWTEFSEMCRFFMKQKAHVLCREFPKIWVLKKFYSEFGQKMAELR